MTTSISLNDFEEISDGYVYLSLNAEHVAGKLFNEVMLMNYRTLEESMNYELNENNQFISLTFTFSNKVQRNFIFLKENGLTLSDADFNMSLFNGDANAYIEQIMNEKRIPICSGVYDEMMNIDACYVPLKWSIDSSIKPEYRVTTTQYQITEDGKLVLPVMIKKQGVFDYYELLEVPALRYYKFG